MTKICGNCEFLSGDGFEDGVCRSAYAVVPSVSTVRSPEVRLKSQNYLVGLKKPYRLLGDWTVEMMMDFPGHYRDEKGEMVSTPGIVPLLTDGIDWWFRDITVERWQSVADVPQWQNRMAGRWRLICTAINIAETVQPICSRS